MGSFSLAPVEGLAILPTKWGPTGPKVILADRRTYERTKLPLATETSKTDEGTVPRLAIQIILVLLFVCLFFFLGFRFTGCSKQYNIKNASNSQSQH